MKTPELLAPAGSMEAAKAAFACGADAVYLGCADFGARAGAGFSREDLDKTIRMAHLFSKKVYVTVNTLVRDDEMSALRDTLSMLRDLHADAVLVQDLGVMTLLREEFPELAVHASTQMTINDARGAKMLRDLGAERVVLARECPMEVIKACADTGVEIEVFVHGALCVCVSGQCEMSASIGRRSGNRGRCGQACRLDYILNGQAGAWLSPRDLCSRDDLPELVQAGVSSLKIEGRLKRPEYVAYVTKSYRKALDAFEKMSADEREGLQQMFHRGGFTRGYAFGAQDADVVYPAYSANEGILLGRVIRVYQKGSVPLCDVRLEKALHNGDGLELRGEKKQNIIYSGPDCADTATLRLHEAVMMNTPVFRLQDEAQLQKARDSYAGEAAVLPVAMTLTAHTGDQVRLTAACEGVLAEATGDAVQCAANRPIDEPYARRALEKTGGTPFVLTHLTLDASDNAFVPMSALNALRRDALNVLTKNLSLRHEAFPAPKWTDKQANAADVQRKLYAKTSEFSEIGELLASGADEVIYAPRDMCEDAMRALVLPDKTWLALPVQYRGYIPENLPLYVNNVSQLTLPNRKLAGAGVPVYNTRTQDFLRGMGCEKHTLSCELSFDEVRALEKSDAIVPVYGRQTLMLLNHCPVRTKMGLSENRAACRLCEAGRGAEQADFRDRKGERLPLVPTHTDEGCLISLCAPRARNIKEAAQGLSASFLVSFTDEPRPVRRAVPAYYRAVMQNRPAVLDLPAYLGRFEDGVE